MKPLTIFEKIWNNHVVEAVSGQPTLLYIDLHYVIEVTSPQALASLKQRDVKVRRPDKTFAVCDHAIPTLGLTEPFAYHPANIQVRELRKNASHYGFKLFDIGTKNHGIIHVIGPETGLTQPGKTIVCGDSHTATHGAFGAYAFGIGTSEIAMVFASQTILQEKPKTMEIRSIGTLPKGVTAKDLILEIIFRNGINGGKGYIFEYTGEVIEKMTMEERMTVCNMSIEAGAKAGIIAPDQATFKYIKNRLYAPKGKAFNQAVKKWSQLSTDPGAKYDNELIINTAEMEPRITYGTNPGMSVRISEKIPKATLFNTQDEQKAFLTALNYMQFHEDQKLEGLKIQNVFIGSCTNNRLSDLRAAAAIIQNHHLAKNVKGIIVPGSVQIKKQAEAEGMAEIFIRAGFEWRHPGCSTCLAMNNETMPTNEYTIGTFNRNYANRQGKNAKILLASPIMAAAAAITGEVYDVRKLL
ncbi:MAG: 3-isopropylmalate dehydratase large subunit [bacterium]